MVRVLASALDSCVNVMHMLTFYYRLALFFTFGDFLFRLMNYPLLQSADRIVLDLTLMYAFFEFISGFLMMFVQ